MIVPRFIRPGDKLGVTAPSFGVDDPLDANRFSSARAKLAARGYDLYYWESSGTAKLDFVLQKGNQIIGVEVKKGEHVRSRSLNMFVNSYHPAYSIRLSLKNFGEKDGLKSVPLYAAFCI